MKSILLLSTLIFSSVIAHASEADPSIRTIKVKTRTLINNKNIAADQKKMISYDKPSVYQSSVSIATDGKMEHQCDKVEDHHLHRSGEHK